MRVRRKGRGVRCTGIWMGLAAGLAVAGWAQAAPRDRYFTKTETRANVFVAPVASEIRRVAVLPFKAPTEHIGASISDLFVTEMLRTQRYELLERGQMAGVLSESELALAGLSQARAIEVGQLVGADGVIVGTVMEYGTMASRSRAYPVVALSVRLIDTDSGEVVWSADLAVRSEDHRATLSGHARDIVHEVVAGLYQKWAKQKVVARAKRPTGYAPPRGLAQQVAAIASAMATPRTPTGFAVSDFGLREVAVTWAAPTDKPEAILVERSTSPKGPFAQVARVSPGRRQYKDSGDGRTALLDSMTYYYRLVAVSADGVRSEPTDVLESLTAPPPDPPRTITVSTPKTRTVALAWPPSESEGVVRYRVERADGADGAPFVVRGEVTTTTYRDGGHRDADLRDKRDYRYRVSAINRVQASGPPGKEVMATTLPSPVAVRGFVALSEGVRCVPLRWEPHPDADVTGYAIYRAQGTAGGPELLATVRGRNTVEYLDGNKDPGSLTDTTTYSYFIVAENDIGVLSTPSPVVQATTRKPPPAVGGLSAIERCARKVPLSWTPSSDTKVIGYEVWRRGPDDAAFEKIADVAGRENSVYRDHGATSGAFARLFGADRSQDGMGNLADDTPYRYRVRAVNTANAYSDWSTVVTARTKALPAEPAQLLATTELAGRIRLTWRPNRESDLDRYCVETRADGAAAWVALRDVAARGVGAPAAEVTDLKPGARMEFRIRAVDVSQLESDWSAPVAGQARGLPSPPSELEMVYADAGAALRWNAQSDDSVRGYRVYVKSGLFRWEPVGECAEAPFVLTGDMLDGRRKSFSLTTIDAKGQESPRSEPITVDGALVRN